MRVKLRQYLSWRLLLSVLTTIAFLAEGAVSLVFLKSSGWSPILRVFGFEGVIEGLTSGVNTVNLILLVFNQGRHKVHSDALAVKLIGTGFLMLGAVSISKLFGDPHSHSAYADKASIYIALGSLGAMVGLYLLKTQINKKYRSKVSAADARLNFACAGTSIVLLVTSALAIFSGLWLIFGAVVISLWMGYEGVHILRSGHLHE